eukprot:TRINITY_DN3866_c0_g1_i4.p1 TRINITY_DN3866_c0_g1~~TRINITY_DN3866_c0_g1_i4.p1  ORF type:complete len:623 (-),score=126.61 TRINITY_DN3866_c0_g1_i4:375-2243(-)
MPVEGITRGILTGESSFHADFSRFSGSKCDGFITYKRRKRARLSAEKNVQEDIGISVTADGSIRPTSKEPCDLALPHIAKEDDGCAKTRLDHAFVVNCANDVPFGHWKNVMECILQLPHVTESGIRRIIQDALASAQGKDVLHHCKEGQEGNSNLARESNGCSGCRGAAREQEEIISGVSQKGQHGETNVHSFTECCRSVFRDVIVSEKLVSFCNLMCEHFKGIKADSIFDFSLINSRMSSGQYEHAPELFASDVQQEWTKFEKIGEQMIHLAKSISDIAQNSFRKQVGDLTHGDVGEGRPLEVVQVGAEQNDYLNLETTNQLVSFQSDLNTKVQRTEACSLYKVCSCRECGAEAEGQRSLICDGCEAIYHVSCIKPVIEEIPVSWYCATCSTDRKELPESESTQIQVEIPRGKCVVNETCEGDDIQICEIDKEMTKKFEEWGGTLDCHMELDRLQVSQDSQQSASLQLCKLCKMGEEEGKKMLACGNTHCPNRYYHQRCLGLKQLTCPFSCWYCPSCLCRACLFDRDDDQIVLCDGCDDAYHIYCIVPPRTSIPKGKWYCLSCTAVMRERRKMRMRDESVGKKQKNLNSRREDGASGSVDMLLSAADKLNFEEKLAERKNR